MGWDTPETPWNTEEVPPALFDGTDRGRYSAEADISVASASNDLRREVERTVHCID